MNELNPTNAFGELLLDLIDSQYGGDYDAGIQALVDATGKTEDEIVGIVQGDIIVDSEDLLAAIAQAFPDADQDDIVMMVQVASGVEEDDRNSLVQEIEANEMPADGDEMNMNDEGGEDDMPQDFGYYYDPNYEANFKNELVNEVNDLRARLAQTEGYEYLNSELKELAHFADMAVANEQLPPSYKALLIGNFTQDNQRVAKFSQMANANGVDLNTMLFATKYALGLLTDASQFIEFKDHAASEEDVMMANFSASLDEVVKEDLSAIFNQ